MVAVPELPADAALYVRCLAEAGYFEPCTTDADLGRGEQYARCGARVIDACIDHRGGLGRSRDVAFVRADHGSRPASATQLINKTNQFNTVRRAPDEVAR